MVTADGLLFIEPAGPASEEPVIDRLTRRMTAAFRAARPTGPHWMGFHLCGCGAMSANHDYRLPGGEETNSLCVHYVAHHRGEVPPGQLVRVAALTAGEAEPADGDLQGPRLLRTHTLAHVRHGLGPERPGATGRGPPRRRLRASAARRGRGSRRARAGGTGVGGRGRPDPAAGDPGDPRRLGTGAGSVTPDAAPAPAGSAGLSVLLRHAALLLPPPRRDRRGPVPAVRRVRAVSRLRPN